FMPTPHIHSYYASMGHGIIPGAHRMMPIDRRIKEFCHITGSVNTRNVGFQIFIRHDTASYLDWCVLEELRIQCDAQANTYHISLNLATLLCLYIVGN